MLAADQSLLPINKLQAAPVKLLQDRSLWQETGLQVYRPTSWEFFQYRVPAGNCRKNKTGSQA